ncbi:MAG TPA: phage tail assembly chaperone [Gallionellaceae bacterium]|nr:phage tail assembly chaperone [Gallionellaceae bacterium]
MKFRISANPTFKHPVTLKTQDGQQVEVTFTFNYIKPAAFIKFTEDCKQKTIGDVLKDVIADWGDAFEDADGAPMAYSKEALDALLAEYYIGYDIFAGFIEGMRGAREKN